MLTRIQAQRLVGLVHAQAAVEQRLDHRGDHQVEHQYNSDRHHNAQNLRDEQRHVARVEQAALTGPRELRHAEQAREHAAQDAANAVATERVERIVVAELGLKMADGQVADGRDDQAHDQRRPRLDKARTRRDHHKARNQTGAGAHQRGATGVHALDGKPRDHARRAGRHGVEYGERRHGVGLKLTAAVKAKPAKPKQTGAERHKRHVMRTVAHHAKTATTAKH